MTDHNDATAHRIDPDGVAASVAVAANSGVCTNGSKPHICDPAYIHACHEVRWRLATWRKSSPDVVSWRPARCHSWRHGGPCALSRAAQDYARIKEALARQPREEVSYLVLTLDPSAWTADGWLGFDRRLGRVRRDDAKSDKGAISAAYAALSARWRVLAQNMRREWGKFEYVSTIEQHRSGWPHLNVVLVSRELAGDVVAFSERRKVWSRKARGRDVARSVFGDMLERSGFGPVAFIEPAGSLTANGVDRLAAYIAKLAGAVGSVWDGADRGTGLANVFPIDGKIVGEVVKLSQAPIRAESHFRRIRSSKGFLPAKAKDEDVTGALFDERGRRIGAMPGARMVAAALAADTTEGVAAVAVQLAAADDKYRNRGGYVEDEHGVLYPPRQPRIIARIDYAFAVLDAKRSGRPVPPDPAEGAEPGGRKGSVVLAPMEGATIGNPAAIGLWLGPLGPGMAGPGRRYRIGSRSYAPPESESL